MNKHMPRIEWQVAESDGEWLQLCGFAQPDDLALAAPAARHIERRLALVLVLLFAILAGGWLRQRQAAQASFTRDLQTTIAQQTKTKPDGSPKPPQRAGLLIPAVAPDGQPLASPAPPQVIVDGYTTWGDRVMAQVTVIYPAAAGSSLAYHETRFYRQTNDEWQRIDPDPVLLGPQQTLTTAHFTFDYFALDAAAVAGVAPRLEQFYAQLRRDFGLTAAEATQVIAVEVATGGQPPTFGYAQRTLKLFVPSPALLAVPLELTADDALYQALVYPLASLLVSELTAQYRPSWQGGAVYWWPLLSALPLWAVWDEGGLLAAGQYDILRWLLHNAHAATPAALQAVPDGYLQLCDAYQVWRLKPTDMGLPLSCTAFDAQGWPQRVAPALPLRLDELGYLATYPVGVPSATLSASQIMGMETIVEYVVATYGRDALPRLVTALGNYASWRTLIPAVFGVSAADFEAGWLAYLEAQYGKAGAP